MRGAVILSSARSGSTMLSGMMNLHPEVLSLSEFFSGMGARSFLPSNGKTISSKSYLQRLRTPTMVYRKIACPDHAPREYLYGRDGDPKYTPGKCSPLLAIPLPHLSGSDKEAERAYERLILEISRWPERSIRDHHLALFESLSDIFGGEVWVERSGGSLSAASTLMQAFPDAKFVLSVRDPRDIVLSMRDFAPARYAVNLWSIARKSGLKLIREDKPVGAWQLLAIFEILAGLLPSAHLLKKRPSLEDLGGFWSDLMIAAAPHLARKSILSLKYERLLEDPEPDLRALCHHLDIEPRRAWLDACRSIPEKRKPRWTSLDHAEIKRLEAALNPGILAMAAWENHGNR